MWLLLFAACWRPDLSRAPEALPPLEPSLFTEEQGFAQAPGEAPEGGGEPPAGPAEADPDAPPFDAYPAVTTTAPVTIVDDFGKPLSIVRSVGTPVEVRGEETIRRKVFCAVCAPAAEGWVQTATVTGRGEKAPAAPVPPPGPAANPGGFLAPGPG
jgi:hypothetical protein